MGVAGVLQVRSCVVERVAAAAAVSGACCRCCRCVVDTGIGYVEVCCSVLQCDAGARVAAGARGVGELRESVSLCGRVLQCVAVCCSVL